MRERRARRFGCLGLVKLFAFDGRTEYCRDEAMHLAAARMSFEGRLREEQLAIERHLEPAAAARQQHRPGDPRRPPVEELSHQTGGSTCVVSDDAELDLKFMRSVGRLGVHARTLRCDACRRHPPTPGAHGDGPGKTLLRTIHAIAGLRATRVKSIESGTPARTAAPARMTPMVRSGAVHDE